MVGENEVFPIDIGKCLNCKGNTISTKIDLCSDCATKQGICPMCKHQKHYQEFKPEDSKCKGHNHECFTNDVGSCLHCGEFTASSMMKLCQKCSFAKGTCGICLKPFQ